MIDSILNFFIYDLEQLAPQRGISRNSGDADHDIWWMRVDADGQYSLHPTRVKIASSNCGRYCFWLFR
jgi:hypothetical protein